MINIDTDHLQDLMAVLQSASDNIDSAAEKLLSITTHNEWGCKERVAINDYILENRNMIKVLQDQCSSFCSTAKIATEEFIETEKSIAELFPGIEGKLGAILSVINAQPVAIMPTESITRVGENVNVISGANIISSVDSHHANISDVTGNVINYVNSDILY